VGLFDLFARKGTISGRVSVENLPEPRLTYFASVSLFRAASADAEPEWLSPPAHTVKDQLLIKAPNAPDSQPFSFSVQRVPGFYHVMVGVVVMHPPSAGRATADIKNYFPSKRALEVLPGETTRVRLTHDWRVIPDDLLKDRGTMKP
jgi:hypothetical protein